MTGMTKCLALHLLDTLRLACLPATVLLLLACMGPRHPGRRHHLVTILQLATAMVTELMEHLHLATLATLLAMATILHRQITMRPMRHMDIRHLVPVDILDTHLQQAEVLALSLHQPSSLPSLAPVAAGAADVGTGQHEPCDYLTPPLMEQSMRG